MQVHCLLVHLTDVNAPGPVIAFFEAGPLHQLGSDLS
jgi:hypothetical protein